MHEYARERRGTLSRHQRAVVLWNFRGVVRSIPRDADPAKRGQWLLFAWRVCHLLGRKQLATVAWPWRYRPPSIKRDAQHPGRARRNLRRTMRAAGTATPRGRASNPTALP